jgi:hypothetical protein
MVPKPSKSLSPKEMNRMRSQEGALEGWRQIADFLGEPMSVVRRWETQGMPVRREGRSVTASPEELDGWLGKESGKPVHVATETTDLSAELKRGLSFIRTEKSKRRPPAENPDRPKI